MLAVSRSSSRLVSKNGARWLSAKVCSTPSSSAGCLDGFMLYGRLGEQERVRALLEAARDRRSGALLVVGEPGAGKSALLDKARAEAGDIAALEARGVESESRLPYASLSPPGQW